MKQKTDKEKFEELINKFPKGMKFSKKNCFTDAEIIFMWKFDRKKFAEKYPGVAEYYMDVLDN